MTRTWTVVATVVVTTLLAATGCSSSFLEPMADPVGTWTLSPDGGSTIVVRADRTFTAEAVPQSVACARFSVLDASAGCEDGGPMELSGSWALEERNPVVVRFEIDDRWLMNGLRSGKTLGFWVGDRERPDPTYEYVHG